MAKILYAWELGSGLGHMAPYRGLFEKLCARGHSLTLVLRDLSRAKTIFKGLNVSLLQSPVHLNKPLNPIVPESTYAQILHNVGFEDVGELETRVSAWRGIFELTAPDMAISDHSPTAMVAWRGLPLRKIVFGSGFSIPPDTYPLGTIRAWQSIDSQRAKLDEDALCARVNRVLSHFGQPTLARIGQLFSDVDDRVFRSYPELDHYGPRQDETYWGLREGYQGEDFEWPAGDGPKIFAYLRCFERFEVILQALRDLKHPTLISSDRISEDMLRRFETKHLRIERRRFNMDKVCAECSVALLNTNHNTMCKLLLAGKPILNMPLTAEQEMLAVAVQRL
jgi:UDP:flavonoid glycosyltransferase YjiC (YdhE family)